MKKKDFQKMLKLYQKNIIGFSVLKGRLGKLTIKQVKQLAK